MNRFEYVSIFYGIIVALALENVASSFHKLFEAGDRVRWHWMAPLNAVSASVVTLGWFWLRWITRNSPPPNPTFLKFLAPAFASLLLYLICAAALPDEVPPGGIDLREFYFSNRRRLWSLVLVGAVLYFVLIARTYVSQDFDTPLVRFNTSFVLGNFLMVAMAASLLFVRRPWWHAIGIIAIAVGVFAMFGPLKLV